MAFSPTELKSLAKLVAKELAAGGPQVVGGATLPTFDISSASSCCEGHCPCDSRNGGDCPCASKCQCDGKVAMTPDYIDMIGNMATLNQADIKKVLDVGVLMGKVRGTTPNLKVK